MRVLALTAAIGVKVVAAALPVYYMYPLGKRFAESWMGVRDPLGGFGLGALVAIAVIVAFVASSAIAASGSGRATMMRACVTTALVVAASSAYVLVSWLAVIPTRAQGAALIATQAYDKYPPVEAIWPLMSLVQNIGFVTLLADITITIAIVRTYRHGRPPPAGPVSTASTSTAAT